MTAPLLVTEAQAREMLSGGDPSLLTPPIRLGRRKFYSVAALDRAVREKAGLPAGEAPTAESAYDAWKKSCA